MMMMMMMMIYLFISYCCLLVSRVAIGIYFFPIALRYNIATEELPGILALLMFQTKLNA
jgi:hypothetical protein